MAGVSAKTDKLIWGLFAGRCAMCRANLIHAPAGDVRSLVGEVAHIVGEREGAARGVSNLTAEERNSPDNLMLLCRREHKIIDDNEAAYPVQDLHGVRREYLAWLETQLAPAKPWKVAISAFAYLNVPRLSEYAATQGYTVQTAGPPIGLSLHEMGMELHQVMMAFRRTLEAVSIKATSASEIVFINEAYVGALISIDRLRFRTRNMPQQRPKGDAPWSFSGDFDQDPHIYCQLGETRLILNIDPRWITTSTAYGMFRPSGGHSLFSGFARITQADFEGNRLIATALALGLPDESLYDSQSLYIPSDTDLTSLEDASTKSRADYWKGDLADCDFCGRAFALEKFMIDGPIRSGGPWGCCCAACFIKGQQPIGPGRGQLYKRDGEMWRLVGGYPAMPICD